jgi:hypothetical protein
MADAHKYQAHEVLNRVLNSGETALQVDIVAGAEYAEDSEHTSTDTGNFVLGVRNDTLAELGGTDGDYVPFQMNADGALYVEISSGGANDSIYVDDADWTDSTSKHTLVGGLYQSSPQTITDGDVGPFQVDADGALHISDGGNAITVDGTVTANLSAIDNAVLDAMVVDLAALETLQTSTNTKLDTLETTLTAIETDQAAIETLLTAANVDHAANEVLLGTIDADTGAIKTAVEIIDNAISGSEMQVDIVADGAGLATAAKQDILETTLTAIETDIAANEVLLGTIDADTGAIKTAVEIIDNAISGSEMQVDVVASLPAGSAAIGKLAANSGVDIGDVDVTSLPASTNTLEVVGDAAENAAAAGNPVLTGGRYDSPGNDNATVRALGDNDVGALALDPTGALYVREYLGQTGSCFVSGTSAVTAAIGKFVAIQFLEDTVFNSTNGLVATDTGRWPDDSGAASDISSSNTAAVGSQVFPQGMTIFGRWDSFILVSGAVIAYVGNV